MSCYWELWCQTCNARVLDASVNHGERGFLDVVRDAPALAALARAAPHVKVDFQETYGLRGEGDDSGFFRAEAFLAHAGHELAPRDEHGRWSEQCPLDVSCSCCGSKRSCVLGRGHAGACRTVFEAETGGSLKNVEADGSSCWDVYVIHRDDKYAGNVSLMREWDSAHILAALAMFNFLPPTPEAYYLVLTNGGIEVHPKDGEVGVARKISLLLTRKPCG